jgi:tungstate transport system ATP-binding protein
LTLIGPNGAGKSTLLLCMAALVRPEHGQITYRGQLVRPTRALAYRRRIALVLQDPLLLDASVDRNVAAGLAFRRLPREEARRRTATWLGRLGIEALAGRQARTLSGGEAQRVSLARAFALEPDIMFLDEPFAALDPPSRGRLMDDFRQLQAATGIGTITVTHDMNEALRLADRVAVLLGGRLRQLGPTAEVFGAPVDGEVAAFVGVETRIAGRVTSAGEGLVRIVAAGRQLEAIGDLRPGQPVLACLRPEDVSLWAAGAPPPSSARNRLGGAVTRLTRQGPLVQVEVDCGFPVTALITAASAGELALAAGVPVTATFKASAVHLIPQLPERAEGSPRSPAV